MGLTSELGVKVAKDSGNDELVWLRDESCWCNKHIVHFLFIDLVEQQIVEQNTETDEEGNVTNQSEIDILKKMDLTDGITMYSFNLTDLECFIKKISEYQKDKELFLSVFGENYEEDYESLRLVKSDLKDVIEEIKKLLPKGSRNDWNIYYRGAY